MKLAKGIFQCLAYYKRDYYINKIEIAVGHKDKKRYITIVQIRFRLNRKLEYLICVLKHDAMSFYRSKKDYFKLNSKRKDEKILNFNGINLSNTNNILNELTNNNSNDAKLIKMLLLLIYCDDNEKVKNVNMFNHKYVEEIDI